MDDLKEEFKNKFTAGDWVDESFDKVWQWIESKLKERDAQVVKDLKKVFEIGQIFQIQTSPQGVVDYKRKRDDLILKYKEVA